MGRMETAGVYGVCVVSSCAVVISFVAVATFLIDVLVLYDSRGLSHCLNYFISNRASNVGMYEGSMGHLS